MLDRARRYDMPMPLRYRTPGANGWQEGEVENISRTGVLFRAPELRDVDTPIELNFQLPVEPRSGQAAYVLCSGSVVRTVPLPSRNLQPALAVTIRSYRFVPKDKNPSGPE